MLNFAPRELAASILGSGGRRAVLWTSGGVLRQRGLPEGSAEAIVEAVGSSGDYLGHAGLFLEALPESEGHEFGGTLIGAFIHSNVRGQAGGGVRLSSYDTVGEYLSDGMRLALGMGRKSALAGLWHGGGKGVIALDAGVVGRGKKGSGAFLKFQDGINFGPGGPAVPGTGSRRALFRAYGSFVTSLRGAYVVAEDAGVDTPDMADVFSRTRFATCIPAGLGGSNNPSPATARGCVVAIEAALAHLGVLPEGSLGDPSPFRGLRFVVQGMGNVSTPMMEELIRRGASSIIASDVDAERFNQSRRRLEAAVAESGHGDTSLDLRLVGKSDNSIYAEPADVVCPNALGACLNDDTIAMLHPDVKIVCGAANNQLRDEERHAAMIRDKGIVFVPDFVANRMGIVQCANEQYGYLDHDDSIERHFGTQWHDSIYNVTRRVLSDPTAENPYIGARHAADALIRESHPIWGDRAQRIVMELAEGKWVDGNSAI